MRIQSLSIVTYWFPHRLPHLQSMTSSNAFLNQKLVIWYSRICYTFHVYRMLLQVVAMAEQVGEQKLSRTWAEQSHWYSVCDFVAQCTQQGVSFRGWWGGTHLLHEREHLLDLGARENGREACAYLPPLGLASKEEIEGSHLVVPHIALGKPIGEAHKVLHQHGSHQL